MTTTMTAPTRRLRVASYNIHECVGGDGRRDPARVALVLREIDADVIGLQEVDARPSETSASMQMQYLASTLHLHSVAGPTLQRGDGHYGNALLTRRPVLDVRHIASARSRARAMIPDIESRLLNARLRPRSVAIGSQARPSSGAAASAPSPARIRIALE